MAHRVAVLYCLLAAEAAYDHDYDDDDDNDDTCIFPASNSKDAKKSRTLAATLSCSSAVRWRNIPCPDNQ